MDYPGSLPDFPNQLRDVLLKRSNGKIIWQPRIGCYFDDRRYRGEPLPAPYTGLSDMDVFRAMRTSNRLYEFHQCVKFEYRHPGVITSWKDINEKELEYRIDTPRGSLTQIYQRNTSNSGLYSTKWLVETEEEMKLLIWLEEQSEFTFDTDKYNELYAQCGDLGLPCTHFQRANLLRLFYEFSGVENTIFSLIDFPDVVDEFVKVTNKKQEALMHLLGKSPFEWINYGDNIHGGMLSPDLFNKYVLPVYQHRNEVLHSYNKFTQAHWDGDTKPLLPFAKETMLDGIEAITPIPQGDVTLDEIKEHLGDMFLLDGIPAIYFDKHYPVSLLIEHTKRCIELFAPNLVLGISDEMSSQGEIDRMLIVRDIVDEYNSSI